MNLTTEQQTIVSHIVSSSENTIVKATAGCGKTTVMIEAERKIPAHYSKIFLAFNKRIIIELEAKLSKNTTVSTIHSFGFEQLRKAIPGGVVLMMGRSKKPPFQNKEEAHIKRLFSDRFAQIDPKDEYKYFFAIKNAYTLARLFMCNGAQQVAAVLENLAFGVEMEDYVAIAKVLEKRKAEAQKLVGRKGSPFFIDFTDMIWLPAVLDIYCQKFDFVFIDESQDMSVASSCLIDKITKGKFISVGDPMQAIYGFAGASREVFEKRQSMGKVLPMTVSFRCSKAVVAEASKIDPTIKAAENAIDGAVIYTNELRPEIGDFVLSRNNAPVIAAWFKLLHSGIAAHIKGKELHTDLISYIKQSKASTGQELTAFMAGQLIKLEDELKKLGVKNPTKAKRYKLLQDIAVCLSILGAECGSVNEIKIYIERIFNEDADTVAMMTIHKAKGLECKNVWLINREDIGARDEDSEDEMSILFVALTRAKDTIYYVEGA